MSFKTYVLTRKKFLDDEKRETQRKKEDVARVKDYVSTKQEKTSYNPKDLQYPIDPSYVSFKTTELWYKKNPIKKGRGPKGILFYV